VGDELLLTLGLTACKNTNKLAKQGFTKRNVWHAEKLNKPTFILLAKSFKMMMTIFIETY